MERITEVIISNDEDEFVYDSDDSDDSDYDDSDYDEINENRFSIPTNGNEILEKYSDDLKLKKHIENVCCICLDNKPNIGMTHGDILHVVMCKSCHDMYKSNKCPYCNIESVKQYINE